jgi:hypothetical protein
VGDDGGTVERGSEAAVIDPPMSANTTFVCPSASE